MHFVALPKPSKLVKMLFKFDVKFEDMACWKICLLWIFDGTGSCRCHGFAVVSVWSIIRRHISSILPRKIIYLNLKWISI